jgi:hypothetical protein
LAVRGVRERFLRGYLHVEPLTALL